MDSREFEKHEQLEERHWWFEGRRRCINAVLETHLRPVTNRRILDVGCGTGGMFPVLGRFGAVVGAEQSADARERAQRRFSEFSVVRCDLPDEVPEGSFDLVTAFDVIEHLDQPVRALRAIRARLAPAGQLLVTVPAFQFLWSPHDEALHHRRRYSPSLLSQHITAAGFRISYQTFFNSSLFLPVALARLASRLRPRSVAESDLAMPPEWLNQALTSVLTVESHILRHLPLKVGVSLLALAECRL